jgi:hypothetical protein
METHMSRFSRSFAGLSLAPVISSAMFMVATSATSQVASAQVRVEAVAGSPFGVGRIEVTVPERLLPEGLGSAGIGLTEKNGRVLYPVIANRGVPEAVKSILNQSRRPLGRMLGDILNQPGKTVIHFLFQGEGPLEITLQTARADSFVVRPRTDSRAYGRLFRAWWREYTARPGLIEKTVDCPPVLDNYLETMLASRLNLPLPETEDDDSWQEELLGLAQGSEPIRLRMQRDRFLGRTGLNEVADRPLPEPVTGGELPFPTPADVEIEPLSMHVPEEFLYIRFGSFANFLWLQDTLAKWGGDAQNLIALRGLDYQITRRIEEQLVLKTSALARMVGGTIIADVAIVGTDLLFQDGGAFGIIFQARNSMLLSADLIGQRNERIEKGDGVTEQKVDVGGRPVSLLASPDGAVRSFYAVDGDFHLVTRSRRMVERFFEAGSGKAPLGATKGLRFARSLMPLERGDSVFVYLSEPFFQNLVGPGYRVETVRRMRALADIELVQLARLAAGAEGQPGNSIEELIAGGFLPADFGPRPDGSLTVIDGNEVYDSLRGRRGTFLPVPDVEVSAVTLTEVGDYHRFREHFHSQWGRLDPIVIGVGRKSEGKGLERVVVDARMTPFSKENYQRITETVGRPDNERLALIESNAAAFEMILAEQRVFGGLEDVGTPVPSGDVRLLPIGLFRNFLVGYLGTNGPLGPLRILNLGIPPQSDAAGFARSPLDGWRLEYGPFTLFSFQPQVLSAVAPRLQYEEAQRQGQLWIDVDDPSNARITHHLNNLGYARTRETSRGNLRLLHALSQQLHVRGEDCLDVAETLLDAKLICPLGGEYEYRQTADGAGYWTSTALDDAAEGGLFTTQAPEGFISPPLSWFRGLQVDARVDPEALSMHAEVLMQMPE